MIHGSPIGNPPPLTSTFIPNNLPTIALNPDFIRSHLTEEISLGRMSGPFSIEEAFQHFGGHFRTAPLGIISEPKLHLIRHLSKKDPFGHSTNSWINSDEWPTKWITAAMVANYVSVLVFFYTCVLVLPVVCVISS